MLVLLGIVFVLGYSAIALEHPLRMNKSASALLTGGVMWMILAVMGGDVHDTVRSLSHHLAAPDGSGIVPIILFLLGAMTIVELIDSHDGFGIVTSRLKTRNVKSLLWLIALATFFMSAVLDNLTTAIVMVSLTRKLVPDRGTRLMIVGLVVIAANAGGAWSPIGDVTTTMLWIGGQISTLPIIENLFLPSLVNLLVPLVILTVVVKGDLGLMQTSARQRGIRTSPFERTLMFTLGIGTLIAVPVFKMATHLPPYMGMLTGLGFLWFVSEVLHRKKSDEERQHLTLAAALRRVDMASIIFFLGILLAVAVLETTGQLAAMASFLDRTVGNQGIIVVLIGLVSAVVDNVPIVASTMGMYSMSSYPPDCFLWEFIAYCAGTGGSILIIGSAAGVAAMGIEKIEFFWYLRKIGILALVGYFAGAGAYVLQCALTH